MGVKKRSIAFAAAISAAMLVPLVMFGGSSFAHGFAAAVEYGHGGHGSGGSQYQYGKTTICHHTHSEHNPFVTIRVGPHAAQVLLARGDTLGPCLATTPPAAKNDNDGDDDSQGSTHGDHHSDAGVQQGSTQGQNGGNHGGEGHGGGHGK